MYCVVTARETGRSAAVRNNIECVCIKYMYISLKYFNVFIFQRQYNKGGQGNTKQYTARYCRRLTSLYDSKYIFIFMYYTELLSVWPYYYIYILFINKIKSLWKYLTTKVLLTILGRHQNCQFINLRKSLVIKKQ